MSSMHAYSVCSLLLHVKCLGNSDQKPNSKAMRCVSCYVLAMQENSNRQLSKVTKVKIKSMRLGHCFLMDFNWHKNIESKSHVLYYSYRR